MGREKLGDFTNEIQYGILEFAGIKTKVSAYGPCEKQGDEKREARVDRGGSGAGCVPSVASECADWSGVISGISLGSESC